MTESINLDSSDLVHTLGDLGDLENIHSELQQFRGSPDNVSQKIELELSSNLVKEENEEVEVMETEEIDTDIGTSSNYESVTLEVDPLQLGEEMSIEPDLDHVIGKRRRNYITRDIVGTDADGQIVYADSIADEEIVVEDKDKDNEDDVLQDSNEDVEVTEESVVEEDPIFEQTVETSVSDNVVVPAAPSTTNTVLIKSESLPISPKVVTSGVYVVAANSGNLVPAQSILQGSTVIASKDQPKVTRMVVSGNLDTAGPSQTIRIMAPQGKLLGNSAKAITLAQARQMGLFTQAKINNILPAVTTTKPAGSPLTHKVVGLGKKTVTVVKSHAKILPAPPVSSSAQVLAASTPVGKTKVLIRQAGGLKPGTIITGPGGGQVIRIPATQAQALTSGNIHQLQVPSKQVQYVKLVNASGPGGGGSGKGTATLVPVGLPKTIPMTLNAGSILTADSGATVTTSSSSGSGTTSFKIVPISASPSSVTVSGTTASSSNSGSPRVLIPASAVVSQSVSSSQASPNNIVMLPSHLVQMKKPEKVVVPSLNSLSRPSPLNGRKVVTPQPKAKEAPVSSPTVVTATLSSSPPTPVSNGVTSANATPAANEATPSSGGGGGSAVTTRILGDKSAGTPKESWSGDESGIAALEANGLRLRKPCNCTKSMCLKLYCDCFANGEFCHKCNCTCCYNNLEHEEDRQRAIRFCLGRNPSAFRPKIGKSFFGSDERAHFRGCNCRRSGCLKNYCECFEAKIPCSRNCKCVGCKNWESSLINRRMVAEEENYRPGGPLYKRSKPYYSPYDSQKHQESLTARAAYAMITDEVIQATCQCMVAQVEDWEKDNDIKSEEEYTDEKKVEAERLIIEEFSRCIVQIIDTVNKSTSLQSQPSHHSVPHS